MKLFLVRHGSTSFNEKGIIQGRVDVPLSKKGEEQIEHLSKKLKNLNLNFDIIFSSPYRRAVQSSLLLAKTLSARMLILDFLLSPKSQGIYEGKPKSLAKQLGEKHGKNFNLLEIPEGETFYDVVERAEKFLSKNSFREELFVVTHAIPIKAFLYLLTDLKEKSLSLNIPNASLLLIDVPGKRYKFL